MSQERGTALRPFHVAVPVGDLDEARRFYGEVLGCREGRSDACWVDFDLFGHQFVCHLDSGFDVAKSRPGQRSTVDGKFVPVPHYGVVLDMGQWEDLVCRLTEQGLKFLIEPYIRFRGQAGEQGTLFIADPSGNALEFKGFRELNRIFEKQDS